MLGLCGYRDAERQALSDATCTALQLANFWQDVIVDLEKDRVYLPLDVLEKHGYPVEGLFQRRFDAQFRAAMKEAVDVARELFLKGLPLAGQVDRRLAIDLELFSRGGMKVLEKIERQDYNVLRARPAVTKMERVALLLGRRHDAGPFRAPHERSPESYAFCEAVARREAKNFYYSFLLLPAPQAPGDVRHLRVHALLRRSERRRRNRRPRRSHRAMEARTWKWPLRAARQSMRCGRRSWTRWSGTTSLINISST